MAMDDESSPTEGTDIEPLSLIGRGGFLVAGLIVFFIGLLIARVGWNGFTSGDIATVSLERNSPLWVYSYAVTVVLIGAGPLLFGAAMLGTALIPRRIVKGITPLAAAGLIAWLIAIPLAAFVFIGRLAAKFQ